MNLSEYFEKGVTYQEYMAAFETAVAEKRTSGPIQTPEYAHYTELNLHRMKRLYKHTDFLPEFLRMLEGLDKKLNIICITEFWCGDAAQCVPPLQLASEKTDKLQIRYLFRDENLPLIDQYLSNGGRGIPKYILLDAATGAEVSHWGPRPHGAQEVMVRLKAENATKEVAVEEIQRWYNNDKSVSLQKEWITLLT